MANEFRTVGVIATGAIDLSGASSVTVPTPSSDTDAASKGYADSVSENMDIKGSCRVATAAALPANTRTANELVADGNGALNDTGIDGIVTMSLTDRVLVQDEVAGDDNGLWVVTDLGSAGTPWKMERTDDADTSAKVTNGLTTWIQEGTVNAARRYTLTTSDPITLNTTPLVFTQTGGTGLYVAGDGLDLTGNSFSLDLKAAGGLKIDATEVAVEPADFAGTGLEDDGADNLRLAAQGTGITGGAGSTLSTTYGRLTGNAIEGDTVKSGRETLAAAASGAVAFAVAFPTANYAIAMAADQNVNCWYSSKLAAGFTANASAVMTGDIDWIAVLDA